MTSRESQDVEQITTRPTQRDIGAYHINKEYWLAGIWSAGGQLLWSSEPDSYDTEAQALEAARLRNLNFIDPR